MSTLDEAIQTIRTWASAGCTGTCVVQIDPPGPTGPTGPTAPTGPTGTIPWSNVAVDTIVANLTDLKTISIQYRGATNMFEVAGTA
jgi:hypothetical protein